MSVGRLLGWCRASVSATSVTRCPEPERRRRPARRFVRRLAAPTAVLVALPIAVLALTVASAGASGAGVVTLYPGLSVPEGIAAGPHGNLWFANSLNTIGRITRAGVVTDFSGAGITPDTATKIVTQVPVGATKGYITVTTLAGTATSTKTFKVT